MGDSILDTNVLITATAAHQGGQAPRKMAQRGEPVQLSDRKLQNEVYAWVRDFRKDPEARLVIDVPERNIHKEYGNKLSDDEYGRMVAAEKLQRWQICEARGIEFVDNGTERVARLPEALEAVVNDKSDRKLVAAAIITGAPIINVSDTDWLDWEPTLKAFGVVHTALLPEDLRGRWLAKKAGRA